MTEQALRERGFELVRLPDLHDPSDYRLALRDLTDERLLPLAVDFLDPQVLHRLKHGVSKQQPMARALGLRTLKRGEEPFVFDATAGLGIDAFFIAALGCRVVAVERSPVTALLLEDGFRRLCQAVEGGGVEPLEALRGIVARLSFQCADATSFLARLEADVCPDVIYMDPMYPEENRSESALPKKAMRMFRRLVGDDVDATALFEIARKKAKARVVVKRPLRAEPLGERPTHSFEGKTARYDMYQSFNSVPEES